MSNYFLRPVAKWNNNPTLRRIVDTLPGYSEAITVADTCLHRLQNLSIDPDMTDAATEIEQILATGTVPDDFGTHLARQRAYLEDHNHQRSVLDDLAKQAAERASIIVSSQAPTILSALNDNLGTVLDVVRSLAKDLDGALTADQAVAAGKKASDAWRLLPSSKSDYDQIRTAQNIVMIETYPGENLRARSNNNGDPLARDTYLANLDEIWPTWSVAGMREEISGDRLQPAPWPVDELGQIVWLATSNAEPWVPTKQQLLDLWEERIERNHQRHLEQMKANGTGLAPKPMRVNVGRGRSVIMLP